MTYYQLLLRALFFFRRANLWVVLGAMLSTTVLVGALIVGDSIRYSLHQIVLARLGKTEFALSSGDRFFDRSLAGELSAELETVVAPLLHTGGVLVLEGGRKRVNDVQILGVDHRFGVVGGAEGVYGNLAGNEAIVNTHLAAETGLSRGEEFVLRIEELDYLPKDAPLASGSASTVTRRFVVVDIADDSQLGRYTLNSDQIAPRNVFVSLTSLSEIMELQHAANVLLVAVRPGRQLSSGEIRAGLKKVWSPHDVGLKVRYLERSTTVELRSDRIFIDTAVAEAVRAVDNGAQMILTYFVNELRCDGNVTPYSFLSAPGTPAVPDDMKDGEILLNEWCARDLNAHQGDTIELVYYVPGAQRQLIERSSRFTVRGIVPIRGVYSDRDLLPDFPGLAGADNCRDWQPGFPIDLSKIRDVDEAYWSTYGGTPKAFVTLPAAQEMWGNRFGEITAIRFKDKSPAGIERGVADALDPERVGLFFSDVRQEGLQASRESVDFAQLFLGLSFFTIASALLLMVVLCAFNIEKRGEEYGTLLALGFTKVEVRRLVLGETAVLIAAGSLLGGIAGIFYDQIILHALKTVWVGAVGTSSLTVYLRLPTIVAGICAGGVLALLSAWLVLRRQVMNSVHGLQRGLPELNYIERGFPWKNLSITILSLCAALLIVVTTDVDRGEEVFALYFMAGFLLLLSGGAFAHLLLRPGKKARIHRLNLSRIGIRNLSRHGLRSLALICLLACGVFIVFTVGANRRGSVTTSAERSSGTGGFALFAQCSIPVLDDLNRSSGRDAYLLRDLDSSVSFVQFRVKDGDDASCLNLNRVARPQLIGVDIEELSRRGAFSLAKASAEVDERNPWLALDGYSGDVIPAFADQTVIMWGLGRAVGDTLIYQDEWGEAFKVKLAGGLANSILQGNIIISEEAFMEKFPSVSGYRLFLIDAPRDNIGRIADSISMALVDQGIEVSTTSQRLAVFHRVENTYLSIFLLLGSFGLMLGSIGIAIVIWRSFMEREGELALLRSIGFSKRALRRSLLAEHAVLLLSGIALGGVAALLATAPALETRGAEVPLRMLAFLLLAVLGSGLLWTCAATAAVTARDLLPALRNE